MRGLIAGLLLLLLLPAVPLSAGPTGDFSFRDLAGKTYTTAGLKGTPLVVNIGSHW
jgi:hypothetical protein